MQPVWVNEHKHQTKRGGKRTDKETIANREKKKISKQTCKFIHRQEKVPIYEIFRLSDRLYPYTETIVAN